MVNTGSGSMPNALGGSAGIGVQLAGLAVRHAGMSVQHAPESFGSSGFV
jgi:hypothetical protein